MRLLHLAASTSEAEVETALSLLLEQGVVPNYDTVRDLVHVPTKSSVPVLRAPVIDLSIYDRLLIGEGSYAHA